MDAAQAGRGAALLVTGEPGIGKSRLVNEISRRLGRDVVLESRCAPAHRDSPLFPIVETLIGSGDSLPALFEQNGLDAAERLPALARVCALPIPPGLDAPRQSPEREKELALDTLVRGLVNMAARHPLLLIIEDLHWADPTTVEFAVQLVDELHSGAMSGTPPPWLVLFTARGEFAPPWPTDAVATVALDRLAPPESGELVRGAVGDGGVPAALVDVVVQRADGVPLFLEELAREVADARADNTDAGAAAVPASLRDLLAARLDRLSFGSRETAQMAAVLGREFRYELLRAVCGRHERVLRDELRELVRSGLMVTQRAARVETFAFKHALVRDAAYDGMLRAARMNVHCRAAAALRRRFPEVAAQQPEVVAQHHEAGGELDDAVDHWTLAGDRAAGRGAYREAIQAFEHALRLVEALPPSREGAVRELAALTSLGTALLSTEGYAAPAVEEAFIRAQRLCEALGSDVPARVLHGIWGVPIMRSDRERAVRLLPAFNRLIQRSTDPVDLITGHAAPALFAFFRGNFERARDGFETASAWYRTKGYEEFLADYGYDGGLYTFGYLMWCESILGHPRRALELREEIYALAARHTTPYGNAIALGFAANVAYELRDAQTAFDITARDIPVLTEQKIYLFLASAMATHGWALGALGEPEAGFANLSGGLALLQTIGCRALYPLRLTQAAEIHLRRAAVADALGAVDEGLGLSADLLDCMSVPELQRLKGECKRRAGQPVPAEAHFQAAIDLALEQGARTCALRAAVNLAELLAAANRRSPARAVLEPIYELFTDGVDTTDILAARALLTALD
jgi:tetratricopeptide (TPR) repeat protein